MINSGIEWIGEIPDSWRLSRVKYLFYISKTKAHVKNPTILKLARSGVQIRDISSNEGQLAESYEDYNPVAPEDLLLNPMDLYSGANCNMSEISGVISPAYVNLRKRTEINSKFFDYFFKCQYWTMAMFAHGKGISFDNRWTINADTILNYEIPLPPYDIQNSIVEAIKMGIAKVDKLVEIQQAQIEKLKEYKQSVITEAVTKGIDPNVPMKDSGVEWIGEVPSNYLMKKMGWIADYKKGPFGSSIKISMFVPKGENTYKVYEQKNAIYKDEKLGSYYISKEKFEELSSNEVLPGDIIVSCAGTIGECYQMPENMESGIINQALMRVRLNSEIIPEYFLYLFDAVISKASQSASNGSAMKNIPPFDVLKNIRVFIPSIDLQRKIVDFLNKKCRNIQCLLSLKQTKIEKLEEYKKSLIYEYVTGKKEVG